MEKKNSTLELNQKRAFKSISIINTLKKNSIQNNDHFLKLTNTKSPLIKSNILSSENIKIKKHLFHGDSDQLLKSIIDLKLRQKKSMKFAEIVIKHKIEEDLSAQININNSKDEISENNFTKITVSNNSEIKNYFSNKDIKRKKKKYNII